MSALLQAAAEVVSPRHRRWRRLLAGLTLDPDLLPRPVPPPGQRDFLVCGSPRTGTALLVAMLYQPPSVVTVMEPWDALRLPPAELFASLREEIDTTGGIGRGRLDVEALDADGSVRWCRDEQKPHRVDVAPGFLLGVKLPAFWRYLELLPDTKFVVCLRDPAEVVSSYEAAGGRLEQGLDYDVPFNRRMNEALLAATADPALRRLLLYDYINERILPHLSRPNVFAVRYERWFSEPRRLLGELGEFLGVPLDRPRAVVRPPRRRDDEDRSRARLVACSTTAAALGYAS